MNIVDKAFSLKQCSLFRELNLEQLLAIAEKMEERRLPPGKEVFSAGQEAYHMHLIVEGTVLLQHPKESTHSVRIDYDFFGEESLFTDLPRAYSAETTTSSLLLSLSRTLLLASIEECPSIGIHLLELFSSQITMRRKAQQQLSPHQDSDLRHKKQHLDPA
jgi:CRP-like cAMP-binding protein